MKNKNNFIRSKTNVKIPKKPKNRLKNFLAWFFICLTVLGSICGIVTATDRFIVNADTITNTWTYTGNYICIPICYYESNYAQINWDGYDVDIPYYIGADMRAKFDLYKNSEDTFIYLRHLNLEEMILYSDLFAIDTSLSYLFTVSDLVYNSGNDISARSYLKSYNIGYFQETVGSHSRTDCYMTIQQFNSSDNGTDTPLIDIVMVRYGVERILPGSQFNKLNDCRFRIVFTDSLGSYIVIYIYFSTGSAYLFDGKIKDRSYFLTSSISDNIAYNNGKQEGLAEGLNRGKEDGFIQGKEIGLIQGKEIGRADGIRDANDYSFMSLISSVVDVPIQTIAGLLDFDLLGVNLMQFFYALITIALILFVVRLII